MKKRTFILILLTSVMIYSLYSCQSGDLKKEASNESIETKDSLIKRGNYLVTIGGCNDCHSPKHLGVHGPEIDSLNMLSGFSSNNPIPKFSGVDLKKTGMVANEDATAFGGPWGISFAANLTPDETGIGNWSEGQFKNALRHGKYMGLDGSRTILPPMPWQNYAQLSDKDIKAVFYYLKSLKPFKNKVPQFVPAAKG